MARRPAHWAVIPAAGSGKRMQANRPKQYLELNQRSVIECSLTPFISHPLITGVVIALQPGDRFWNELQIECEKPLITVDGGEERCHSVCNALKHLSPQVQSDDWVLVHDAARPCLSMSELSKLIEALRDEPVGGLLAIPARDTIKKVGEDTRISETLDRSALWHAQTPQMFRYQLLLDALLDAIASGVLVTDESAAVERRGLRPRVVEGRAENVKLTHQGDLEMARYYLQHHSNELL